MKKKVLLLNLPGKEKYLREYFCSKISKAKYYYTVIDLVYMSAKFDEERYELTAYDAILEKDDEKMAIDHIKNINPDVIYFLASAASYREDKAFLDELKNNIGKDVLLIGSGDIFRELKQETFNLFPRIDAINFNFATDDIMKVIDGMATGEEIENVMYRHEGNIIVGKEKFYHGEVSLGSPRWDLFNLKKYNNPFAIKNYSNVMLTDFGCPYSCSFCPMSNINFSMRPLDEVFAELRNLKKLGVNDLFFLDQTFGMNKERTKKLCAGIKDIKMHWSCFTRVDVINEELVKTMKSGGCHTVLFGIESSDEDILKKYKKNTKVSQMIEGVRICQKYGLRVGGTFIIGLPGDDEKAIRKTVDFAIKLDLDFASFNIITPRIGTNFRQDMITLGWADPKELNLESTKQKINTWKVHELSQLRLQKLQSYAVRSFYLRPRYLIKKLFGVRSAYDLYSSVREAAYLIFGK